MYIGTPVFFLILLLYYSHKTLAEHNANKFRVQNSVCASQTPPTLLRSICLSLSRLIIIYSAACMCRPPRAPPTPHQLYYIYNIYYKSTLIGHHNPGRRYIYIGRNESKCRYIYIEKKKNGRYIRPILFYDRHQSSAIVVVPATAENGEKKNILF